MKRYVLIELDVPEDEDELETRVVAMFEVMKFDAMKAQSWRAPMMPRDKRWNHGDPVTEHSLKPKLMYEVRLMGDEAWRPR